MFIYIFLLVSLCIGNFFDFFKIKKGYILFFINFIVIFILVSTRYGIGPDYFLYERLYSEAKSVYYFNWDYYLNNKYNIEIGYLFFESLVKVFTDDFSLFLFIYNIVLFFILFLGILNTKNYNIQLFIFFTLFHIYYISGQRQVMAIVIFLYNIKNLLDRRYLKFFILSIIGGLFHSYSILYIFLAFLCKCKLIKYFNNRVFIFAVFLFVIYAGYMDLIGEIIKYIYFQFGSFSYIFGRIYYYYFEHYAVNSINILNSIKVIMIFSIVIYYWNSIDNRMSLILLLYVFIFFIFVKASGAGGLAFRLSDGLLIILMPYVALLIEKLSMKKRLYFCMFITLYGSIIFCRILYIYAFFNVSTFLPYRSILF